MTGKTWPLNQHSPKWKARELFDSEDDGAGDDGGGEFGGQPPETKHMIQGNSENPLHQYVPDLISFVVFGFLVVVAFTVAVVALTTGPVTDFLEDLSEPTDGDGGGGDRAYTDIVFIGGFVLFALAVSIVFDARVRPWSNSWVVGIGLLLFSSINAIIIDFVVYAMGSPEVALFAAVVLGISWLPHLLLAICCPSILASFFLSNRCFCCRSWISAWVSPGLLYALGASIVLITLRIVYAIKSQNSLTTLDLAGEDEETLLLGEFLPIPRPWTRLIPLLFIIPPFVVIVHTAFGSARQKITEFTALNDVEKVFGRETVSISLPLYMLASVASSVSVACLLLLLVQSCVCFKRCCTSRWGR